MYVLNLLESKNYYGKVFQRLMPNIAVYRFNEEIIYHSYAA